MSTPSPRMLYFYLFLGIYNPHERQLVWSLKSLTIERLQMLVTTHRTRVFIFSEDKFLVMVRNFKLGEGKYRAVILLPGGGVDEGEESQPAMEREVMEELGLRLKEVKLVREYKNTRTATASEKVYWPGASKVLNEFDFYTASVDGRARPILKEPEKFLAFDWISAGQLQSYAHRYKAEIGDGITDTIAWFKKSGMGLESGALSLPLSANW